MSWLFDAEKRRPDPKPVQTDDRKPVIVGLALWIVALVVVLLTGLAGAHNGWVLLTILIGIVLGVAGLVYTFVKHSKA